MARLLINSRFTRQQIRFIAQAGSASDLDSYLTITAICSSQSVTALVRGMTQPNGKIHRVNDDGTIPEDNPFAHRQGAIPSIWTYGHRNAQGLTFDPVSGDLWESEHGPRGGDELNIIERGRNYGWPTITYGINYDGTPITDH